MPDTRRNQHERVVPITQDLLDNASIGGRALPTVHKYQKGLAAKTNHSVYLLLMSVPGFHHTGSHGRHVDLTEFFADQLLLVATQKYRETAALIAVPTEILDQDAVDSGSLGLRIGIGVSRHK